MNAFIPILQRVTRTAQTRFGGLLRDRRGAAALTIAVAFTALAGLAGLGVEGATWYYTQRRMQSATDAAAHTGATALMMGVPSDKAKIQACSVALSFGINSDFTCDPNTNVHIPPIRSHTTETDAVEVDLSQQVTMLFSGMFISTAPTIQTYSIASANGANTNPPCVMSMDTNQETSMSTNGTPALTLNNCSLYVNSSGSNALNLGGGTISAAAAYVVGGENGSGLTTTNGLHTGVPPHPDPYASVPNPTSTPASPSGTKNNDHVSGNKTETYCSGVSNCNYVFTGGIQVDGGSTLNFCPGTYYINGGTLSLQGGAILNAPPTANTTPAMSSTICGTNTTGGVTIILMNSTTGGNPANINFTANSIVSMTAPTSGTYSGLALFQERATCSGNANACANSLNGGGTQNIQGAIYMPNNSVDFNGGASSGASKVNCTQLFAYKINFSGNSNLYTTCSGAGTQTVYVSSSSLVE